MVGCHHKQINDNTLYSGIRSCARLYAFFSLYYYDQESHSIVPGTTWYYAMLLPGTTYAV